MILPVKPTKKSLRSPYSFSGFTLVELIVVITILVILGTIGFVSLQGYSLSARDSVRVSDMTNITKGLEIFFQRTGSVPVPDMNVITLTASGSPIGYQGYVGSNVLSIIKTSEARDPLDKKYYTYVTNAGYTKYQVLGLTENSNTFAFDNIRDNRNRGGEWQSRGGVNASIFNINTLNTDTLFLNATHAGYETRTPFVKGSSLGVLLGNTGSTLNMPVQENYNITSFTGVDVVNTSTGYVAYISQKKSITGTGISLKILTANNPKSPITYALSCRDINDNGLSTGDGVYYINPTGTGSFQAYCDMTTDGGGWTMIFNEKNIGSFWDGTNKYTNFAGEINCTGENRNCVNRSYSTVPVTNGVMLDGAGFDIGINKYSSKVVFNGVNNIKYRTLYYLFNNSGAQSTPTETHWLINEPKIITGFQNSVSAGFGGYTGATSNLLWDYGNIIYQFQNIVLNEDQASGLDGLISGAWDNGCKWPNNPCFPDHWYSNYRLWFR